MLTIALSALGGVLLGLRFRALILPPATVLVLLVTAFIDAGAQLWFAIIDMVAVVTALQFGYLAGVILWGAVRAQIPSTRDKEEAGSHLIGSQLMSNRWRID